MPPKNERRLRRKELHKENSISGKDLAQETVSKGSGKFKETKSDDEQTQGDLNVDSLYQNLVKFKYMKAKSVAIKKEIQQLYILNKNELLCVVKDGVLVYNLNNLYSKRHINLEKLGCVKSIAEISKTRLAVACSDNNGLYEIDSSGKHTTKITAGSFCDICNSNGKIYALEEVPKEYSVYTDTIISIFSLNEKNRLEKQKQIVVDAGFGRHTWDKISVESRDIYISSLWNNCIYVYDCDGERQYSIGRYGSEEAGNLYAPHLCGVDHMGNALVADWNNDRLQIYDYHRKWHVVDVDIDISHPSHAVVDVNTGHLVVATSQELILFKKEGSSLPGGVQKSRICTIL